MLNGDANTDIGPLKTDSILEIADYLRAFGKFAAARRVFRLVADSGGPHSHSAQLSADLLGAYEGDLLPAFRALELWESQREGSPGPGSAAPRWQGEDLAGKSIFVPMLRGFGAFGESIMLVRFAKPLADRGARVIIDVEPDLVALFKTAPGVSLVLSDQEVPPHDLMIPIHGVLPRLGTTLDSIPKTPYLFAAPERVAAWRSQLSDHHGLKVGIVWSGNPPKHVVPERNMHLSDLMPLIRTEGVTFFGLQKGNFADEIGGLAGRSIVDLAPGLQDWNDTAALVAALDLVIAPDTAIVHLAGALGRPVWMMDRLVHCWRWLSGREESYWYPTLRIFRQTLHADWSAPIQRAARELTKLAESRSG